MQVSPERSGDRESRCGGRKGGREERQGKIRGKFKERGREGHGHMQTSKGQKERWKKRRRKKGRENI